MRENGKEDREELMALLHVVPYESGGSVSSSKDIAVELCGL